MREPDDKTSAERQSIDWRKVLGYIKNIAMILTKGRDMDRADVMELIFNAADLLHEFAQVSEQWVEEHPREVDLINRYSIDGIRAAIAEITTTDPNRATWVDLSLMYMFEIGDAKLIVTDTNAPTLADLREHEGVVNVRGIALESAQKLAIGKPLEINDKPWNYQFDHIAQNLTGQIGLLPLFLGTYNPMVTVTRIDAKEVELHFEVYNKSHLASLTRFRRAVGDKGNQGILTSKNRGQGFHLGGNFEQFFQWKETHTLE